MNLNLNVKQVLIFSVLTLLALYILATTVPIDYSSSDTVFREPMYGDSPVVALQEVQVNTVSNMSEHCGGPAKGCMSAKYIVGVGYTGAEIYLPEKDVFLSQYLVCTHEVEHVNHPDKTHGSSLVEAYTFGDMLRYHEDCFELAMPL